MRRLGKDTSNVDDFVIKLVRFLFYFHELWGWKMAAVKLRIQVSSRAWAAKKILVVSRRGDYELFFCYKSQGLSIIKSLTVKLQIFWKNISCFFMLISLKAFFPHSNKSAFHDNVMLTNVVTAWAVKEVRDVERN